MGAGIASTPQKFAKVCSSIIEKALKDKFKEKKFESVQDIRKILELLSFLQLNTKSISNDSPLLVMICYSLKCQILHIGMNVNFSS